MHTAASTRSRRCGARIGGMGATAGCTVCMPSSSGRSEPVAPGTLGTVPIAHGVRRNRTGGWADEADAWFPSGCAPGAPGSSAEF